MRTVSDQNIKLELHHDKSMAVYKALNLDDDEYVVIDVQRSRAGLAFIWIVIVLLSGLFIGAAQTVRLTLPLEADIAVVLTGYLAVFLTIIAGAIASSIYRNNKLIVSNQRVFSRIQNSPFDHRWQTIEIEHIEDVSYIQSGILPVMFNYGTLRLSTIGDEHTYIFSFVADPDSQYSVIQHIVQLVDEGRESKIL
jgi:hypothetical protein